MIRNKSENLKGSHQIINKKITGITIINTAKQQPYKKKRISMTPKNVKPFKIMAIKCSVVEKKAEDEM